MGALMSGMAASPPIRSMLENQPAVLLLRSTLPQPLPCNPAFTQCIKKAMCLSHVQNAWRGRQNASVAIRVLDQFFKGALTASMGNDLQNKDLALPAHSDRAHKLLAENLSSVNMSYDVY
jgi:hypothetical protein